MLHAPTGGKEKREKKKGRSNTKTMSEV